VTQQPLRQQCAKRAGDEDWRFNELRQGATQVIGVVGERRGAQEVVPFAATMPTNAECSARAAALGGMKHKQLRPDPRPDKGTMDKQDRSVGRPREDRFDEFESRIAAARAKKPRRDEPAERVRQKRRESILASCDECKPGILSRPEEPAACKLAPESFPGRRPALSKSP